MPGLAKTNELMLGTATVMIGPEADLFDLNPTEHSIGLVKNFSVTSDPTYTDLSQGVKNTLVYSVMTNNAIRASMETYEYTAQNIAYGLGLAGTFVKNIVTTTVAASVSTGLVLQVATGDGSDYSTGDVIMILNDTEDDFIVRKVVSVATDTLTLNVAFAQTVALGATVKLVSTIGAGSKTEQPFYSAKIAGKLANGEAIVMLIPKLRVVQGFNLAFSSDDFANMPFEFTVYDLVNTDTHYSYFGGDTMHIVRT